MYIRTKDSVYEVTVKQYNVLSGNLTEEEKEDYKNITSLGIGDIEKGTYKSILFEDILFQSDKLEACCDEFCYIKDGVVSQYLTIDFKFKRDDEFCTLKNKLTANGIAEVSKGISKYELENGELKFAIWTSKGLIYVAKMNEKGELELI